jgi:ElaB/YqjD/DUF883 family membrane-anchored ribosome-binding protein
MRTTTNDGATGAAINRVAAGAHNAVDKIADATTGAAETLSIKGEQVVELQEKWLRNVREYVNENPLKSLGMAVTGGYLLSLILRGRRLTGHNGSRT